MEQTKKGLRWLVWGLGCTFYFYEFFLQVSPSVMARDLMHDFAINAHTLGNLSGCYFYSYAGMQIFVGLLLDRFGAHRLLALAALLCGVSSMAFGLTHHVETAALARFFMGFGSAFAAVGTMKLAYNWFPPHRFSFLVGLMVTIGMLGALAGEAPLALLVKAYGWRDIMLFLGGGGVLLSLLIYALAHDRPALYHQPIHSANKTNSEDKPSLMEGIKVSIKNKQLWLVITYGGLMYLSTPVFCGLWGVPYLSAKYSIASPAAAALVSMVLIGWVVGSPLWGWWSDHIGRRLPPLIIGSIGSLLSMSYLLYLNPSIQMAHLILFLFGFFSCAFLPTFSIAREIMPARYCATALGFTNMMNMVGVAFIQPFIGKILDNTWEGVALHSHRYYTVASYTLALSILPALIFIALLLTPWLKETYCRSMDAKY